MHPIYNFMPHAALGEKERPSLMIGDETEATVGRLVQWSVTNNQIPVRALCIPVPGPVPWRRTV